MRLMKAGRGYLNPQARFDSVAMAVPKKNAFRIIADYCPAKQADHALGDADAEFGGDRQEDDWSERVLHAGFVFCMDNGKYHWTRRLEKSS